MESVAARPILGDKERQDISRTILGILSRHQGAGQAITGRQLSHLLGHRNDRKIRLVIQQLISDGQPIAASVSDPVGYYVIANREEAEAYVAVLRSRATKTFERLRDFQRAVEDRFGVPYQPLLIDLDADGRRAR